MPRLDRRTLATGAFSAGLVVLAVAWPVLDFVAVNEGELVPVGRIAGAAAVLGLVALSVVGLVTWRTGSDARRVAMVVAWLVVAFLNFHVLFDGEAGVVWRGAVRTPRIQLVAWVLLAAIGARLVWLVARWGWARQFAVVFLGLLTAVNVVAVVDAAPSSTSDGAGERAHEPVEGGTFERRPNIYHFILDQYPRADEAEARMGLDISPFLGELEARGFWVGDEAYTAYGNTMTAIPSILEMDYVFQSQEDLEVGVAEMTRSLLGQRGVVEDLRAEGYAYLYASAGPENWSMCRGDAVDRCLQPEPSGLLQSEVEEAFLKRTPLSMLLEPALTYTRPVDVVDSLEALPELPEPFFLLAHVWQPHEPLEYHPDCTLREHVDRRPTREKYADEMVCLNQELLGVIDRIQARDPDAVIMLQGDHGTAFGIRWEWGFDEWDADDLHQRFSVLDARTVPDGCEAPGEGPTFTVNTYRWLLACLRGEEPDELEPRAFWWNYDFDGPMVELDDPLEAFGRAPSGEG